MAVQSTRRLLREARTRCGMTQEKMADGICSPQALSRIECGSSNVSPATFEALMNRAGSPHTCLPVYTDRNDFECYRSLKYARKHLDAWQLEPAHKELQKIKKSNWADNNYYYQEWLFLYCRLHFRSYQCSHRQLYRTLLSALHITRPHFTFFDPANCLLSKNELEILTAFAQEALYLGNRKKCIRILNNVEQRLTDNTLSVRETVRLRAEAAIVRVKYLLSLSEYENAFQLADAQRHQMAAHGETAPLYEITFLAGLCAFRSGHEKEADVLIKSVYFTARHVESCYASKCLDYLKQETTFPVTEQMLRLPKLPFKKYPKESFDSSLPFLSNSDNENRTHDYTLGNIIRDFRTEQGLSQRTLCFGLCSKSKLSKIESKALQPDISLAEALLQRLGISECIFTFCGSEQEAEFFNLRSEMMYTHPFKQQNVIQEKIENMESLTKDNDILRKQACLTARAAQNPTKQTIPMLKEALRLTLPDFDIHDLLNYRLSYQELSILNKIAHLYAIFHEPGKSSLYFLQLLEYQKRVPLDIHMSSTIFTATNYLYCHSLYIQKNYQEIVTLTNLIDLFTMRYNLIAYMLFLFYYCQALGACPQYDNAAFYSILTRSIADINEFYDPDSLKKYL